jgi:ankyrin repeat protein
LLKAGADVNANDNEGMTAFEYAGKRTSISVFHVLQEALDFS